MQSFLILLSTAAIAIPAGAMAQDRDQGRYSQEQTEQAIHACREAVRQQAANRFGARGVEFRGVRVDPDGDRIAGTIDIPRSGYEDHFQYTCSMDFDRDEVRSVNLQPMGPAVGYRERSAEGPDRAMDNCRNAVASRIAGQGYGDVQFNGMHIDQDDQRIVGNAQARRGDDFDSFHFSCRVELRDGDLRSVNVTRR